MNARNFSGRSWPSFRRHKFLRCLQALQLRRTCSCFGEMPSWRTSTSSPKFFLLCGRHRLKAAMWWVPNQRSFRIVSVPSDKLTGWLARLWLSPRGSENPRPARKWRHPRRRLLDLQSLTGWAPLHPRLRGLWRRSRPFELAPGRARWRPFQERKKSGKTSSSTSTRQRWRVPGGGSPGRLCPALAESAGQLPGHWHRRGRGGHCIPATTSAHPSKHHFPDQEQPTGSSASRRCLADEGSHRASHQREVPRILQSVVLGTQEDRRSVTCNRPVHSNRHMVDPHFKMETQGSVRSAIRSQEWTVSIDIRDAYLHVPMHQAVRKYLRFVVNKKVYQFTCLPFGLATSPREFTKLLRPVVSLLRQQGV